MNLRGSRGGTGSNGRLLAFFVRLFFRGQHQFKTDLSTTLATLRELLMRLKAGLVRQAMFGVQDFIDPRAEDRLTRFVNFPAGIGSHALY
jgi:hypothetical protein